MFSCMRALRPVRAHTRLNMARLPSFAATTHHKAKSCLASSRTRPIKCKQVSLSPPEAVPYTRKAIPDCAVFNVYAASLGLPDNTRQQFLLTVTHQFAPIEKKTNIHHATNHATEANECLCGHQYYCCRKQQRYQLRKSQARRTRSRPRRHSTAALLSQ